MAGATSVGEPFRDDLRGAPAGAGDARRLLPAGILAVPTRLSPWRSLAAIGTTAGLLSLAIGAALLNFTSWVAVPAVALFGTAGADRAFWTRSRVGLAAPSAP